MGKKTKKPGKGKEKTEKKTAKAEVKKARRETKKLSPEDDIDAILVPSLVFIHFFYSSSDEQTSFLFTDNCASLSESPVEHTKGGSEEEGGARRRERAPALSINPLKETELVLYGGEFYNGNKTFVYGDLYWYDVEKQEWKLVSSPNSPPPRSTHQAVAWKNYLYIFGGEFTSPNQERFHHYKTCAQVWNALWQDFWVLDLKTNQWEQLNYKGCPSSRSGHRMVLYKHKIIVFGGFYDTLREVRYFNDLHVFDLDLFKWQEIKGKPGCMWPSARSGFQFTVYQDEVYLYGGYSKEVSSDKNNSEKGIVHSDMWSLDPRTWEWNKVKKSGMPPGPRAGFSMCVHKKRALLFGGVVDMSEYVFRASILMHRSCAVMLELRKEKSTKEKIKRNLDGKSNGVALDSKSNLIETMNSAENDGNGNLDYNEVDDMEINVDEISRHMNRNVIVEDSKMAVRSDEKSHESSSKSVVQNIVSTEASESEWIEASEDDDEDDDEDDSEDEECNSGGESNETYDDNMEARNSGTISLEMGDAVAIIKGEAKNLRRKEKRARIEQIRASLGLSDSQRTPMPGESLKDF
ncbi:hypothetical protein RJ639_022024 [Escallonia herrerae]|uniref:DUF4110 domain-containing protein n=1 Tax=Escallonia herrerae TaxID=1293975 RepID=A0AA88V309_9ASTE|nr:hypothetical protein RJ639_022024 [Escallonia herrerae]